MTLKELQDKCEREGKTIEIQRDGVHVLKVIFKDADSV